MTDGSLTAAYVPEVGQTWQRKRDGYEVTILSVRDGRVRIMTNRQSTVRLDRFHRDFCPWPKGGDRG